MTLFKLICIQIKLKNKINKLKKWLTWGGTLAKIKEANKK